ncbi:MAG: right-handed parallel beta-helix repeat-containing protein, partial [Eudoraea sp.]|nr:right-handed parallel beta-helix repeat-containing protein [Eudoraea sp.]
SASLQTMAEGRVAEFKTLSTEEFEIRFEDPLPEALEVGDALENLSWIPDALIQDNRFMSCRARGVLLSTPGKVVVEGNHFESSGSAILIAGDANNWYESGAVKDVTIRNNVFAAPCLTSLYQFSEAVISIYPEIPDLDASEEKFHRNIRILDNDFHLYDYPVLYAKSVDGLQFKGNRLIRSERFAPFHPRKYGFSLLSCRNVEISGNSIGENVLGKTLLLEGTMMKDVHMDEEQGLTLVHER